MKKKFEEYQKFYRQIMRKLRYKDDKPSIFDHDMKSSKNSSRMVDHHLIGESFDAPQMSLRRKL